MGSMFLESNGAEEKALDGEGNPLQGHIVTAGGVILRFIDGLLDGGMATARGEAYCLPAVESPGHLEWWKAGRLHREDGPAVVSDNFRLSEWWQNGKKLL
jgi:hypothetical protein